MADQCDAVLIVGSDYTDVATPSELSTNARIAANLGAPVVLAVQGQGPHPDQVAQVVELCLAEIAGPARAHRGGGGQPLRPGADGRGRRGAEAASTPKSYVLPEEPLLVAPVGGRAADRRSRAR